MVKFTQLVLVVFLKLLFSASLYSQWILQTSGTTDDLYSTYFVNKNTGFVSGESGLIMKSVDGGSSWATQYTGFSGRIYSIRFTGLNNGWAVGESGTILFTNNGGLLWGTQVSGTDSTLRSVFFIDSLTGWAVGNSIILNTTNGGLDWMEQSSEVSKIFYSVFFKDSNTGWITGYSTLKTTNGGETWLVKDVSTNRRSVFFVNYKTGWVSGGAYTICKNTNGGESWDDSTGLDDPDSPPAVYTCVNFINENTGWYTSSHSFGGRISMTTNNGISWFIDYPTTRNRRLNGVYGLEENTAWAVGERGTILKRSALTGVNGVNSLPSEFSILQNFPNPFNPVTKINFSVKTGSRIRISIIDVSGKEIVILTDGKYLPGNYQIEWNAVRYSSGVYFCNMITDGFSETKKLVLIR